MPEIESFVFFDIETTGLPFQERNQTKIIEFSFVAALRKDIEEASYGNTPPVSKLTFVLNPQRPIHPEVAEMTGLTNKTLCNAPTFTQKTKSIISFLEDLPKPVCLVAHNGNSFDFKILLVEMNDTSATLPVDLLCVDSLVGFRNILKGTDINYTHLETQIPTSTVDDLLTDDEDDWPDLNLSNEDWKEIDDLCTSLSDISCEDFEDDKHKKYMSQNEITRLRSEAIRNVFNKSSDLENSPQDNGKEVAKNVSNKKPKGKKVKDLYNYKLTTLYKRLLNKEEENAHRAEVDCIMLVQCVVALKNEFLPWADSHCKLLTDIKPLIRY